MDKGFRFIPEQASEAASQVDALTLFLTLLTAFFTILIAALIIYFSWKYRRKSEVRPAETKTNYTLEIAWTVIPLIISMVIFVWGAKVFVHMKRVPEGAMEIYVVGRQWMWKVQHPEGRREINEIHVPRGRPVVLTITSEDVIHSVGIPAFRFKMDAVPGKYTQQWFTATKTGEYHLFCDQYCGTQHAGMVGKVIVMEPGEYEAWLNGVKADDTPLGSGKALFDAYGCAVCHSAQAPSMSGLYGRKERVADGGTGKIEDVQVNDEYLRRSILDPNDQLAVAPDGKPYARGIMPSFRGRLTEEQLISIIAYIKSLKNTPAQREVVP